MTKSVLVYGEGEVRKATRQARVSGPLSAPQYAQGAENVLAGGVRARWKSAYCRDPGTSGHPARREQAAEKHQQQGRGAGAGGVRDAWCRKVIRLAGVVRLLVGAAVVGRRVIVLVAVVGVLVDFAGDEMDVVHVGGFRVTAQAGKCVKCQVDGKKPGGNQNLAENPRTLRSRVASHSYPRLPVPCRVRVN